MKLFMLLFYIICLPARASDDTPPPKSGIKEFCLKAIPKMRNFRNWCGGCLNCIATADTIAGGPNADNLQKAANVLNVANTILDFASERLEDKLRKQVHFQRPNDNEPQSATSVSTGGVVTSNYSNTSQEFSTEDHTSKSEDKDSLDDELLLCPTPAQSPSTERIYLADDENSSPNLRAALNGNAALPPISSLPNLSPSDDNKFEDPLERLG